MNRSGLAGVCFHCWPAAIHARMKQWTCSYFGRHVIGALMASLEGLDGLVFTAGIGEHAPEIRSRVCVRCAWLEIIFDDDADEATVPRITDVEKMIVEHTLKHIDRAACWNQNVFTWKIQRAWSRVSSPASRTKGSTRRQELLLQCSEIRLCVQSSPL